MNNQRFKMKTFIIIVALFSLNAFAQIHTHPPLTEDKTELTKSKKKQCAELHITTKQTEKKFVENYGESYKSEKSFFKLIKRRLVSDSILKASEKPSPKSSLNKCSDEELELLGSIRDYYKKGSLAGLGCKEFIHRSFHINKVERLIRLNE